MSPETFADTADVRGVPSNAEARDVPYTFSPFGMETSTDLVVSGRPLQSGRAVEVQARSCAYTEVKQVSRYIWSSN